MVHRVYVEKKPSEALEAKALANEIRSFLGITSLKNLRIVNRYDVENISEAVEMAAATRVFSEPQSDFCIFNTVDVPEGSTVIVWEYLPGQYDQRADSAEQCLSLLRAGLASSCTVGTEPPRVRCAKMVVLSGTVTVDDVKKIENYLINPVDSVSYTHLTLPTICSV